MMASRETWDVEWAATKAADALRYLGRNYPECLENLRVLDAHENAAHEAAMRGAMRKPTWTPSEAIAGPVETRRSGFDGVRRESAQVRAGRDLPMDQHPAGLAQATYTTQR